ncbi:MAG TPA: hypothetical protein DCP87_05970 [Lactobacillus sp.]|nr:hypothetical protein [Lactobacillus sp.]
MRLFLNSAIVISFLSLVGVLVWYIWDPGSRGLISKITATLLVVFTSGVLVKLAVIMREEL